MNFLSILTDAKLFAQPASLYFHFRAPLVKSQGIIGGVLKLGGFALRNAVKSRSGKFFWMFPLVLAMFSTLLGGCRQGKFIPEANFVDLYVELELSKAANTGNLDKLNETRRVILAQHGVTAARFHETYARLMAHPEAWKEFQEQVIHKAGDFASGHKL